MSESALWKWLRGRLPPGHYTRVESESSWGFPDVDYVIEGCAGKFELKEAENPASKQPFKVKGLRDSQILWIPEHLEHGGVVWIVARVGIDTFFIPGRHYRSFNEATLVTLIELSALTLHIRGCGIAAQQSAIKGLLVRNLIRR